MKDRTALALYLCSLILITSVHDLVFLSVCLAVAVLVAGRSWRQIAKKAGLAILIFNSIVTLSYVVMSTLQGRVSFHYVWLINLRVFLLTYLSFLLVERINLFKAFAFSRRLTVVVALAYSQTMVFRRLFDDFRLARQSRTFTRLGAGDLYRQGTAMGSFFLIKSLSDATSVTEAMKSRGFFDG